MLAIWSIIQSSLFIMKMVFWKVAQSPKTKEQLSHNMIYLRALVSSNPAPWWLPNLPHGFSSDLAPLPRPDPTISHRVQSILLEYFHSQTLSTPTDSCQLHIRTEKTTKMYLLCAVTGHCNLSSISFPIIRNSVYEFKLNSSRLSEISTLQLLLVASLNSSA